MRERRRDVAQISDDDLGAERRELLGTLIGVEHEGPHAELPIEQLSYDVIARRSMSSASARDQKCWCSVLCHKCCSGVCCAVVWLTHSYALPIKTANAAENNRSSRN